MLARGKLNNSLPPAPLPEIMFAELPELCGRKITRAALSTDYDLTFMMTQLLTAATIAYKIGWRRISTTMLQLYFA